MLLGRNLRMRLDCLKPDQKELVKARQARVEATAGGSVRQFEPGDMVWFRDYRSGDKWTAGIITKRIGTTDYNVNANGTEVHRHIDQLQPRVLSNEGKIVDLARNIVNIHDRRSTQPVKRFRPSLVFPVSRDSLPPDESVGETVAAEGGSPEQGASDTSRTQTDSTVGTTRPAVDEIGDSDPNIPCKSRRTRKPVKRYGVDDS